MVCHKLSSNPPVLNTGFAYGISPQVSDVSESVVCGTPEPKAGGSFARSIHPAPPEEWCIERQAWRPEHGGGPREATPSHLHPYTGRVKRGTGRSAVLACTIGFLLGAVGPATAAQVGGSHDEVTSTEAIAFLNAQRAANGLPADIVENVDWSDACAKHARYVELNGRNPSNPHDEDPSKPGYTPEGQQAARSSVLGGTYNDSGENPWEDAPIHLMQLLGPGLAETGYAPGCMWTWPGYTRLKPASTQTYSYPGPGTTIYYAEEAAESPFVPGDFVGLPEGTETGPHLFVFAFGEQARAVDITDAKLVGPTEQVAVRTVDNLTDRVGLYLPPGGILIPEQPLAPDSEYHAVVDGTVNNRTEDWEPVVTPVHWEWTFRTEPAPVKVVPVSSPRPLRVSLKSVSKGSKLRADVSPNWRSDNYWITIQRKRGGSWRDFRVTRTRGFLDRRTIQVPRGTYRVIVHAQRSRKAGRSAPVRVLR